MSCGEIDVYAVLRLPLWLLACFDLIFSTKYNRNMRLLSLNYFK